MTPRVVIVGAGVAGLTTALALARGGLPVDVLERDRAAAPFGRRSAATWLRDGAPQGRHAHVFGPGCHDLLRAGLPDVLGLLLDAGAREVVPAGADPGAGTGLALRRPLLDWVLRRTAERQPGLRVHSGVTVTAVHDDGAGPVEVAVRGGSLTADLVVDAAGGRPAPTTYYSRGYALRWPGEPGPLDLGLAAGGDFDGYTCRAVPGDNHTVTVTFGVPDPDPADGGGLSGLRMPDRFQAAAEAVPGVAVWVEPGTADPLGGVAVLTRRSPDPSRRGVVEGSGLVAVGDAGAAPGRAVEHGVGQALAQALACAAAVLAGGDRPPADLAARVRAATCPEPPSPARRPPVGPSAYELAHIAESIGAGARVSV
jgi:hypothetical protein